MTARVNPIIAFRPQMERSWSFAREAPSGHANSYFGLAEDLAELLGVPIDLVEPRPISNPYFRDEIERALALYEADVPA